MSKNVVLIPGDGIGPAIADAAVEILKAAGAQISWERHDAGIEVHQKEGDPLPDRVVSAVQRVGVCLKGPVTTPVGGGYRSVNIRLRQALDLYANLRPMQSLPAVKTRFDNVDLVIVRENTEGLYAGIEREKEPGVIESIKLSTRKACTRISQFAFKYARERGRKKVSAIHKANIIKLGDGLFLECFREVAKDFPELIAEEFIVDATCMRLVQDPTKFDVMVMENLYGDILSDLGAGLVGGLGITPGANIGEKGAIFEAVHGSAPDIAGKNLANPTALLLSAVMMLQYIGQSDAGDRITKALNKTWSDGVKTQDLGGKALTTEFTQAVIARLH